ncbi:MAG: hypothetical protein QOH60_5582 [Mycobacterium sp.]|jgi:hypothetical protein|nr:hypothetical protein [Mycobacterium sp.]
MNESSQQTVHTMRLYDVSDFECAGVCFTFAVEKLLEG